MKHLSLFSLLIALSLLKPVLALENDYQFPIKIKASKQFLDIKANKVSFVGPVLVTQGSIKIHAEHLLVQKKDNDKQTLIASGEPTKYQQT